MTPPQVWLEATGAPSRAVALVIHGLNLKPERMDAIAAPLRARGVDVLRVALAGHRGRPAVFKRVDAALWRAEARRAIDAAVARSSERGQPLFLVAFSLGALVALEAASAGERHPPFARAVLLAPALALRPRVRLIDPLGTLGSELVLPSATPPDYRANDGTPMAAYRALFELERGLRERGLERCDQPTLVYVDPEDELVSADGLRRLIASEQLGHWRLVEVSIAGSTLAGRRHHLIVDADAVGAVQWQRMVDGMIDHLELDTAAAPSADPG